MTRRLAMFAGSAFASSMASNLMNSCLRTKQSPHLRKQAVVEDGHEIREPGPEGVDVAQ